MTSKEYEKVRKVMKGISDDLSDAQEKSDNQFFEKIDKIREDIDALDALFIKEDELETELRGVREELAKMAKEYGTK